MYTLFKKVATNYPGCIHQIYPRLVAFFASHLIVEVNVLSVFALLFVKYYSERSSNAEKKIREIKGVVESHITSGAYDMILKVKAKNQAELRRTIKNMAKVSGVGSILTSIVYNVPA